MAGGFFSSRGTAPALGHQMWHQFWGGLFASLEGGGWSRAPHSLHSSTTDDHQRTQELHTRSTPAAYAGAARYSGRETFRVPPGKGHDERSGGRLRLPVGPYQMALGVDLPHAELVIHEHALGVGMVRSEFLNEDPAGASGPDGRADLSDAETLGPLEAANEHPMAIVDAQVARAVEGYLVTELAFLMRGRMTTHQLRRTLGRRTVF